MICAEVVAMGAVAFAGGVVLRDVAGAAVSIGSAVAVVVLACIAVIGL